MDTLSHIGVKRRSGRYPWGSGGEVLAIADRLASEGLSEVEIANAFGMSTTEYRNQKSLLAAELKEAKRLNVVRQKENGMSIEAISREFDIPAQTVRDLLKPTANWKYRLVRNTADFLKQLVNKSGFVDIGDGVEIHMNISRQKLDNAIQLLKNEGYTVHYLSEYQLGTGKKTRLKILAGPNTEYMDVINNKGKIVVPNFFTENGGETFIRPSDINNISSARVLVKYNNDGGAAKDGLIELRRGVPELNLGEKRYAQVRIGVDGTHFMKGMAILRDDIPEGYDIIYNTSKTPTGNKLDAMKPQVDEGVSRFGAIVRPNTFMANGEMKTGMVNIVGGKNPSAEGAWDEWNKTLASQVLSKQSPALARKQLDIVYQNNKAELDEINSLTNPVVKKHLLDEFSEKMDRASIDLKAAALPRQTTSVLLPDPNMKPDEIFAPNYNDGDVVSLIRYPHGGIFEIPTLRVNNKRSEYKDLIGKDAPDAVAIHPDVATKLSGADFDGDFAIVVPNHNKQIMTAPSIESLKNFNPRETYKKFDGMRVMGEEQKQRLMGDVSNLITDMTIKGASHEEIARAVRHSMVVIDSVNHELNYKQSRIDNGIDALKRRYQGGAKKGAATLISRAKSEYRVPARYDRFSIDPVTGEKVYTHTEETYINKKTGAEVRRTTKTTKGAEFSPYDLTSKPPTIIETVYADHSAKMKELANRARLATLDLPPHPYSKTTASLYRKEVDSLDAKLRDVIATRPLERKAQVVGNEIYKSIRDANPDMSNKDKSKAKGNSLILARTRIGAKKPVIEITPQEWQAIELGAVSKTKLDLILRNSDMDIVRGYATPKTINRGLSTAKETRAKALIKAGYTSSEVANALGVPVSQVRKIKKD